MKDIKNIQRGASRIQELEQKFKSNAAFSIQKKKGLEKLIMDYESDQFSAQIIEQDANQDLLKKLTALQNNQYKLVSIHKKYICLTVLGLRLYFFNLDQKLLSHEQNIKLINSLVFGQLNQQIKKTQNLSQLVNQLQAQMEKLALRLENNQKNTKDLYQNLVESYEKINLLQNQLKASQASNKGQWVYFERPKLIGTFVYNSLHESILRFDNIITKDMQAIQIKLILFLRTGSEQNVTFWTKTTALNGKQQFVHWTYGHRYPQHAISYNSETVIVPIHETREIRVMSDHSQPSNCHLMQYFISAYKKAGTSHLDVD